MGQALKPMNLLGLFLFKPPQGSWGTHVLLTLGLSPTEEGCPAGMEMVSCANHCPYSCSDLQEGAMCQEDQACQLGCRCSEGAC